MAQRLGIARVHVAHLRQQLGRDGARLHGGRRLDAQALRHLGRRALEPAVPIALRWRRAKALAGRRVDVQRAYAEGHHAAVGAGGFQFALHHPQAALKDGHQTAAPDFHRPLVQLGRAALHQVVELPLHHCAHAASHEGVLELLLQIRCGLGRQGMAKGSCVFQHEDATSPSQHEFRAIARVKMSILIAPGCHADIVDGVIEPATRLQADDAAFDVTTVLHLEAFKEATVLGSAVSHPEPDGPHVLRDRRGVRIEYVLAHSHDVANLHRLASARL